MSYTYQYVRKRDNSPEPFFSRPLIRRSTKRRIDLYDDDKHDDYPYYKPSTALTVRQPTHIEKYKVWEEPSSSSKYTTHHRHRRNSHASSDDDDAYSRKYKYTHKTYLDDDLDSTYKYKESYKRRPSSSHSDRPMFSWPGEVIQKDMWTRVDFERKERERRNWVFDEPERESKTTWRKIKRSRTNEWKPLTGYKHY
ncbi:hypothetical protein BDV96DRAFT_219755 [Lophiotrema nucula]|uniref:Uncharacterized protein n=1 Tax=Lophiotrema nucula TaxID=690887 RepID=A0A6A5YSQ7_9PLEO|nr:hypothetical protein BDV96DRAFT_219755 [Lophiotrema nucula]